MFFQFFDQIAETSRECLEFRVLVPIVQNSASYCTMLICSRGPSMHSHIHRYGWILVVFQDP